MSRPDRSTRLRYPAFGDCVGCAEDHPHGLRLEFYADGDAIVGWPTVPAGWQGATGVVHGGTAAMILDEFSCAVSFFLRGTAAVTGELTVRYLAPCPVDEELSVRAWVGDESHPRYRVIAAEILRDGEVLVRSTGRFFPMSAEQLEASRGL